MANLRDLSLRMRAIQQTLQVTKAMKLISTAKLRVGRRALEDTEPFFLRIQKTMYDMLSEAGMEKNKYLTAYDAVSSSRAAVVVISSDKGLAGGYNSTVFRYAEQLCSRVINPALIPIGNIGYRYFTNSPWPILENFSLNSRLPTLDDAQEIADFILSQYLWGIFDEVFVVYTHMFSSVKLLTRERQLLPLGAKKLKEEMEVIGSKLTPVKFEFWPSETEVLEQMVPLYIKGSLYGCLVEAFGSEHNARMAAMNEASKSAEEMLADLQIQYNRIRQAGITQEMAEIIGGAAVLND